MYFFAVIVVGAGGGDVLSFYLSLVESYIYTACRSIIGFCWIACCTILSYHNTVLRIILQIGSSVLL